MTDQQFEAILRQALCPEIAREETVVHPGQSKKGAALNMKHMIKKAAMVAAAVMLLITTAYATDFMNIQTLATFFGGESYRSESYEDMDKAMRKAGFQVEVPEKFENGYAFQNVRVEEVGAYDENGERRFTYMDMMVEYRNAQGNRLLLCINPIHEEIQSTESPVAMTRTMGKIQVNYVVSHYKFVPEDYELTEEDQAMLQKPGYFLSYGSDAVEEMDNAHVIWEQDGIRYSILDMGANEEPETLMAMAEELIPVSQDIG